MENDQDKFSGRASFDEWLRRKKANDEYIQNLKEIEEANREYAKRNVIHFGVGSLDGEVNEDTLLSHSPFFIDDKRLQNVYFLFEDDDTNEPWTDCNILELFDKCVNGMFYLKEQIHAIKVRGDECSAPRMESLGYRKGYEITINVSLPLPKNPEKYLWKIFHNRKYRPIGFVGTFADDCLHAATVFFQITHYRIKYDIIRRDSSGTLVRFRLAPCHWPQMLLIDCDPVLTMASELESQSFFDHNM